MCERRKNITQRKRPHESNQSLLSKLSINQPKRMSSFSKSF